MMLFVLVQFVLTPVMSVHGGDSEFGCAFDLSSPHHANGTIKWTACRDTSASDYYYPDAGSALSTSGWEPPGALVYECIADAVVPGTILTSLIRNGTFGRFGGSSDEVRSCRRPANSVARDETMLLTG